MVAWFYELHSVVEVNEDVGTFFKTEITVESDIEVL